jgi:vesicle transport protein SEC22
MIRHTLISRLDGLILTASVDEGEESAEFNEVKSKLKLVLRRMNRNSEPQGSVESGSYIYQYALASPALYCSLV